MKNHTNREVADLVAWLRIVAGDEGSYSHVRLSRAAELLERQALVPVPISERLPGPEDVAPCPHPSEESPWCWMARIIHGYYGALVTWEQVSFVPMCREVYTHWLPAHALPVPEVKS